jgi:xanthine permease XanP
MFEISFIGAFVALFLIQFIGRLKAIRTPLTSGIVITTIGIILIKLAVIDLAGGFRADDFDSTENLLLGFTFLVIVVALNTSKHPIIRLSAIFLGMLAGCIIAWWQGLLSFDNRLVLPLYSFPEPFKYGNLFLWP